MQNRVRINSALISVFHKEGLDELAVELVRLKIKVFSTGGTATYLRKLGVEVVEVESLTGFPSILGGRVKTLHPHVHGGILARRSHQEDAKTIETYNLALIDLVVVDLYPFEDTVASGASEAEIIEKIDIGGIALIRAAAKNFASVTCIPSKHYYSQLLQILKEQEGHTVLGERKALAAAAFEQSSRYDNAIYHYVSGDSASETLFLRNAETLRYGENPHQQARYYPGREKVWEQLNGKPLSYNNLVDIDAALALIDEFEEPAFAVIKHTNPCGCAIGDNLLEAWKKALAGDPVSAFGGVLACNGSVDLDLAKAMNSLFFEVLVADDFTDEALALLSKKKKRILLKRTHKAAPKWIYKSAMNGMLAQEKDLRNLSKEELVLKTSHRVSDEILDAVVFGDKLCKHLKSNAIAIVRDRQLIGSGIGQTSRVAALKQAIAKAQEMGFDLQGSILFSDAFFPFADCVEIANEYGIKTIVEPGGSIRDEDTINFCENHDMCLIFTGIRHFKH